MYDRDICHRDIKPTNILLDESGSRLKVCDFGSAKVLDSSDRNASYMCSRFYRAPELILGCEHYSTQIDMWSAGCVLAEMMNARRVTYTCCSRIWMVVNVEVAIAGPCLVAKRQWTKWSKSYL